MQYDILTMTEWLQYLENLAKLGVVGFGSSNTYPELYTIITPMCDERNVYYNANNERKLIRRVIIKGE